MYGAGGFKPPKEETEMKEEPPKQEKPQTQERKEQPKEVIYLRLIY